MKETKQSKTGVDWSETFRELTRRAGRHNKARKTLERLRRRLDSETDRTHWQLIEQIAKQSGVDLNPIFEEARRRNRNKRTLIDSILAGIKADAMEQALKERQEHEALRKRYIKDFGKYYGLRPRKGDPDPELKFVQVVGSGSTATPSMGCVMGSSCSEPDLGTHEAAAWDEPRADEVGVRFHASIHTDNGDCRSSTPGFTEQWVGFERGAPSHTYRITGIELDLWGTGSSSTHLGDPGPFRDCNPAFIHTRGSLCVYVTQVVDGVVYGSWPLLEDQTLFSRAGDHFEPVVFDISATSFAEPDLHLWGPDGGGGPIACYVYVRLDASACGEGGRVSLDFTPPHDIEVGCVTLFAEIR